MPWGWRKRRPGLPYFFWGSPSGKMILLTKKKTTMLTPPFRTVVPMLYSYPGTKCPATATQMQLNWVRLPPALSPATKMCSRSPPKEAAFSPIHFSTR